MNLHLKPFSLRQLLVKIIAYLAMFYLLIIVASIAITGYIFFNLDGYRARIEKTVYKHTGYKLVVGSIQTKLTSSYLPEVLIQNISLINPVDSKQRMHVKTLDFVFSYASIWDLEPIFDQILVDGSNLDIVYAQDGSILLNGINVNNPDRQTLENTKNSPIDVEQWLLKQRNVVLDHITLSYLDKKNGLPQMTLHNIKLGMEYHFWKRHRLYVDVYGKSEKNQLEAELTWKGGKFENWLKWSEARMRVNTVNNQDSLISTLQQYLPGVATAPAFNATTALDASMKDGQLQNLYANFDVNNFKIALADADLVNFPKLGGSLSIKLQNKRNYSIQAKNLMVLTSAGYLFNNASVAGNYLINHAGQISLSNTNLVAINNFLSLFAATSGINIDGTIQVVKFDWQGEFLHPKEYQLYAAFHDISLRSTRPELPSLSHVSGDIAIRKGAGNLNLILKDSVLDYHSMFLIPYVFKSVDTKISWNTSAKNVLTVNLAKTNLELKDFSGWVEGSYSYDPANLLSPSYLDMRAHVDRVATSKVGDYLPKSIPMSVHQWLNMGLIGGDGVNANMILKGPLASFPFKDEKGLFYITADLDNAKLRYVKNWPTLDNIQGKFILRNTNITVKAQSALIQGNQLDPTVVVIPDYSDPNGVSLTANGKAHGSTANFMDYLKNTPVNKIIGRIPEKITASGDGQVDLYLKVPFKDPLHTEVKGSYHFINNKLKLDLPVPELSEVNGDLNFSQRGPEINNLSATAFNSKVFLTAGNTGTGSIWFKVNSPNLDYRQLALYYVPVVNLFFQGRAATEVKFEIANHGISNLTATSDLVGVQCFATDPLRKAAATPAALSFHLSPERGGGFLSSFDYADRLKGQVLIGRGTSANRGKLALNNSEYLNDADSSSAFTINATPESANIVDWLATVKLLTDGIAQTKGQPNAFTSDAKHPQVLDASSGTHLAFPLQIFLKSNHLSFAKINFEAGTANIVVDADHTYFNVYTPIISGIGDFKYATYHLDLNLDKYMLYKNPRKAGSASQSSGEINFMNGADTKISTKIPTIDAKVNNLFYQNHNLGTVSARIHQDKGDLLVESGVLASPDVEATFSGVNSCFGCGNEASYVDFRATADVKDLGNLLYALDLGRVVGNGKGKVDLSLQWNGGFQDFKILQTVGSLNASFSAGKFLKIDPGVLGGLMSIINLQGLFEFGSGDLTDIFKKGFFFNHLDLNADILTSQINLNHIYMSGPMAKVNSSGKVNFASNTVDAYVAVTPKLGFAVALTAGVVTLNPIVGIGVYLGELLFGDPQNKLFTFAYHVSGNLHKPHVERTSVSQQIVKNVNSAVGNSNGIN